MKTVVIRLSGGMGNQMFQYAYSKALAERWGAKLVIDRSLFELPYVLESYRLDEFELEAQFAGPLRKILHRFLLSPKFPKNVREAVANLASIEIVNEHSMVKGNRRSALLFGYFQHPGSFANARPTLRQEFRLPTEGEKTQACLDRIRRTVSVAVHIRRGDYANVPQFRKNLGLLAAEYYRKAIAEMRSSVNDARFFVFSNDPAWVEKNILPDAPDIELIFLAEDGKDTNEMALMRACTHFIIANSTFSWWPALLSEAQDKIVIAPAPWFRGRESTGEELLLPEWTTCQAIWEE